jgi:hypothetical protein
LSGGGHGRLSSVYFITHGIFGLRGNRRDHDGGGHYYHNQDDGENSQNEYSGRIYFTSVLVMVMGSLGDVAEYAYHHDRESDYATCGTIDTGLGITCGIKLGHLSRGRRIQKFKPRRVA